MRGWTGRGKSLRVRGDLGGDTNGRLGLNRIGRGLSLRGRGGRDNSAGLSRSCVGRSGRSHGWREAGVVLGGLDGLNRGGASSRLSHGGAVDLVSALFYSDG